MEEVYRLAPPRKKGLLSLVFSRFTVIVLLLILQILLYVFVYGWLDRVVPFFSAFLIAFTVVMIFYLFNNSMDYSAKLTWMLVIAVFQVAGAIFLLFTHAREKGEFADTPYKKRHTAVAGGCGRP